MGRRPLPKQFSPFPLTSLTSQSTWGISEPFGSLSPSSGQVTNALLTRSPLCRLLHTVRLACIRHAASVHPEPGSNSPHYWCDLAVTIIFADVCSIRFTQTNSQSSVFPVTLQLLRCAIALWRQKTDASDVGWACVSPSCLVHRSVIPTILGFLLFWIASRSSRGSCCLGKRAILPHLAVLSRVSRFLARELFSRPGRLFSF